MLLVVALLLMGVLGVCKRRSRKAFFILQVLACLVWAAVQYGTGFQSFVAGLLPLWVLASLAALAVPTRRRGEEPEWTYDAGPPAAARRGSRPFSGFPFRGGRNG